MANKEQFCGRCSIAMKSGKVFTDKQFCNITIKLIL